YVSRITEVVPVRLEPAMHWNFGSERPRVAIGYLEWPVVTDFVSAATRVSRIPRIQTVPTVDVVGMPGFLRRLHEDVGMAGIIPHDKNRGTRLPCVQPNESGKINS